MTDPIASLPQVAAPGTMGGTNADTSRLRSRANLDRAGQRFESTFTQMMLKSMRQTHLAEDTLFGSKEQDTFRDMQDQQVAQSMAVHQPLGIGRAMTDFLARSQHDLQGTATTTAASPTSDATT